MIRQWFLGLVLGTVAVAVTSPLFVRSYVPRVWQPARQAWVYQPGAAMRWRREGYATTHFGPLGMPGKPAVAIESDRTMTWALWGDSQAEGLCVDDRDKLGNTLERVSQDAIEVLPFARSGDDCNDWIPQIATLEKGNSRLALPAASGETTVGVSGHLFLVTELSDWAQPETQRDPPAPLVNTVAAHVPAFLIHAVRQIVTDGQTMQPRPLRFRLGPIGDDERPVAEAEAPMPAKRLLRRQLQRLRGQTQRRCVFVLAPPWPAVIDGAIVVSPADARLFEEFSQTCAELQFDIVDLRPTFAASVRRGDWPTGFQNGQYGQGHLNALGNRLIAGEVWKVLKTFQRSD